MLANQIQLLVTVTACLLTLGWLARVAWGVKRAHAAGWSGIAIGSWVTVSCFGFGCALAGAVAGSRLVFGLLPPGTAHIHSIVGQVAGALILSDAASRFYYRWLARPIGRWFSEEEASPHDG